MSLRQKKWTIPLLNEDGSLSSDSFEVSKADCSVIADNVAAINLEWTKNFPFI